MDGTTTQKQPLSERRFESTHWSVVLRAAQADSTEAWSALERLCLAYWYPLYAYLRRTGYSPANAEDATQEFFATKVVTRRIFQGVDPMAGRFRSWLLTCLQNMLKNEWEKQNAAKRGGGMQHLSLDFSQAEQRWRNEPADDRTPETIYDRSWAYAVIERALGSLGQQYDQTEKPGLFAELKQFLPGEQSRSSYAEIAARLGKSENAIKMAVSRLRQEFGACLRAEISKTVGSREQVEEELRVLIDSVSAK